MKYVSLFLIMLMLCGVVQAVDIGLSPLELYETNEIDFNLTINNFLGDSVYDSVSINLPGLEVINAAEYHGWNTNLNETLIEWNDGTIETNVWAAIFTFTAKAGTTDADIQIDIPIILRGDEEVVEAIQILIRNDNSSPILRNNTPEDGGWLRQGINDQRIEVSAEDPETGIEEVLFSHWDCNDTNSTLQTLEYNNVYYGFGDFSEYEEGEYMCFEFEAYNNAGEKSVLNGQVGFDGTAPAVNLQSPDDGSIEGGNVDFIFNTTDNLALTLDCDLLFEEEVEDSIIANSGEDTTLNFNVANLSEGMHQWKIICEDGVGLEGESEERNVITGTGPIVNFSIDKVARTESYLLDVEITDETGVDTAIAEVENLSIELDSEFNGELLMGLEYSLGDYEITITAIDPLGFETEETYSFELVTGYDIELTLNPDTIKINENVTLEGTVRYDDGSDVDGKVVELRLPDETVNVTVINSSFSYEFEGPNTTGTYEIEVEIEEDGFEHKKTIELVVEEEEGVYVAARSNHNPTNRGGMRMSCGDGTCQSFEDCDNCAKDCGVCPEEPEEEDEVIVETQSSPAIQEEEIVEEVVEEAESRTPQGVGMASGWFGNLVSNAYAWIGFLTIIAGLYFAVKVPQKNSKPKKSGLNWENYFNRR